MAPIEDRGYTGGAHFRLIETQDTDDGNRTLVFLLPDGSKRHVSIAAFYDSQALRDRIGESLYNGERIYGH